MEASRDNGPKALRAYDVSKGVRLAQVCVSALYLVVSAGIVFGYAALKPVMVDEGVYREYCSKDEIDRDVPVCYGQEIRLNLMFTVAAVAANAFALPVGAALDAFGPRATSLAGCFLLAVGSLSMAYAHRTQQDGYLIGYFLLSIGGPFVFLPSFQLSNTFPRHSGLILSVLTGAFDASSALFLLFRLLHGGFNGFFTIKHLFTLYLVVPAFILVSQIFLMPATSYETVEELIHHADDILEEPSPEESDNENLPEEHGGRHAHDRTVRHQAMATKIRDLLEEDTEPPDENGVNYSLDAEDLHLHRYPSIIPQEEETTEKSKVWGTMHMRPAAEQIRSPWFVLITVFTVIQMLRTNYFISTIRLQYTYLFHSHNLAETLNHIFDLLLPLGGVVAAPLVGIFLDRKGMPVILFTLILSTTIIGILGCIPNSLFAGYANISLFVLFRPFFYTTVSDYVAKVFGFQSFGKVYGLTICLAGVGNFVQSPIDILTFKVFKGNPIPVNVFLTVTTFVVGALLVVFVWWRTKTLTDNKSQRDEEDLGEAYRAEAALNGYGGDEDAQESDQLLPRRVSNETSQYGTTHV